MYSLMDAAYDAAEIRNYIKGKGQIALIDFNKRRRSDLRIMSPTEKEKYKIRSTVERTKSHLTRISHQYLDTKQASYNKVLS